MTNMNFPAKNFLNAGFGFGTGARLVCVHWFAAQTLFLVTSASFQNDQHRVRFYTSIRWWPQTNYAIFLAICHVLHSKILPPAVAHDQPGEEVGEA